MAQSKPEALAQQVSAHPKYRQISADLVLRLSQEAIHQGLTGKPAVKFVRNKLHQVGSAYFKQKVDYPAAKTDLTQLPHDLKSEEVKRFCLTMMQVHASTAERLPILAEFYQTCLAPIAPIASILDLACGLNPLAIPWMPLADEIQYDACDIYLDMLDLIGTFFNHTNLDGRAEPCDLISSIPSTEAQVALLLKSIPCLEQMEKSIASRLLNQIPAANILVSFPVHSLGGRKKGMKSFYRDHFYDLISETDWQVQEFSFTTELAFLVSK